jgi:hypothetical protein
MRLNENAIKIAGEMPETKLCNAIVDNENMPFTSKY